MQKELSVAARKVVTRKLAQSYIKARKKEKGRILDQLVQLTGYTRCYGSWLLRMLGKPLVVWKGRQRVVYISTHHGPKVHRNRKRFYDEEVATTLKKIWYCLDCPCGKRLAPYLKEIVPVLEQQEELVLTSAIRKKLLGISGRTIDRLLSGEKRKWLLRGKCRTKPGSLLKRHIPIRTFADWQEQTPGLVEMDLVSHDGGSEQGIFAQTLDVTDVFTGWTETVAVANKSQVRVFEGIVTARRQFPFPWQGLDSDTGGEFINNHLVRYCQQENLKFTRGRPYKKNDSCYVEQKNWAVVRKVAGYYRYDRDEEVRLLNRIYGLLRLYTNFFQPQMKMVSRVRIGSKVTKKYDQAQTPYQRILACISINPSIKDQLTRQYKSLNPVELKRRILRLQSELFDRAGTKMKQQRIQQKLEAVGIDSYLTQ
jgi:hypothetical protein